MRITFVLLSLLGTLFVAWALTGQKRIQLQDRSSSSRGDQPYHSYSHLRNTESDTAETATAELDPYHQRYYSESEGWTYYTLPSNDSDRGKR